MTIVAPPRPDAVFIWTDRDEAAPAVAEGAGDFVCGTVRVALSETGNGLSAVVDAPGVALSRVALRWRRGVHEASLVMGDAWERSYGDLHWEHLRPERILPWYWLASHGDYVCGAGVRVRPGAFASWTVDVDGITLWLDARSGSDGVWLGDRPLSLATIVWLDTASGDEATPFAAHRELCAAMCSDALVPSRPLVGANNWYYAYGVGFDADAVVRDAASISELSGDHRNRPFSVIDAGWSEGGVAPGGPWTEGIDTFRDMSSVAERIAQEGAVPGLWFRPLLSRVQTTSTRAEPFDGAWPLDPSLPETLELVAASMRRFREWGYELVKHDFSTHDALGRFLADPTDSAGAAWRFADRSRTTAEILVTLYRTIREAAGDTVILGCNTVGHLAAGLEHAQRTGDDTSGKHWERTRRMGVNTLAFRLAQHETFFAVDADCVPSTPQTPWAMNRQFLDLIARSGTALFLSLSPDARSAAVDADVRAALNLALDGGVPGGVRPLDWQHTSAPRRWREANHGRAHTYNWSEPWGADLSLASI